MQAPRKALFFLAAVVLVSFFVFKLFGRPDAHPSPIDDSSAKIAPPSATETPLPSLKPVARAVASPAPDDGSQGWSAFTALVDASLSEQAACKAKLKQFSQMTNMDFATLMGGLTQLPWVPASTSQAIALIEKPESKAWDQGQLQNQFMRLGGCDPIRHKDLLFQLISTLASLSPDSDQRRLGVAALISGLQRSSRAEAPLLTQILQVEVLERMGATGLLAGDTPGTLDRLQSDTDAIRKGFQTDLRDLSEQGENWKAMELEMAAANQIRAKLGSILSELPDEISDP